MAFLRVLITSVPPGEAPFWVRSEWVGLELPLAKGATGLEDRLTAGVLTGPRGFLAYLLARLTGNLNKETGFPVPVASAVEILASKSPAAADWWRENTPHLFRPGGCFMFQERCAKIVEDANVA